MDLTFTIDNPEMKDDKEVRELLEKKMKISFPNDEVNLKNRSVLIKFKNEFDIDIVYLNKQEFAKEKNQIKHIKSISSDIHNIIILVNIHKSGGGDKTKLLYRYILTCAKVK